ncbi:MAG TPA: OmpH family outer membrane protein [Ignavibacteria bacterium]|nr:OmpH family outer membrane protein [Ignavibacteria bacterium]
MKQKFALIIFLLVAAFPILSQQKIGYIDSKVILDNLQDAKDAQTNLDNLVLKWKGELQGLNDSLAFLKDDYEKKKLILTEKVRQQKEEEIKTMEKRISDFRLTKFGENGEYFQKQNELMKPVQDRMFKAIQDVAKEGGYDFVIDRSSQLLLLYMNDKYDLTQKVIRKLEEQ